MSSSVRTPSPDAAQRPHPKSAGREAAARRWWRRRPINRALVLTHRWPALVLGLLLVLETTSGSILLYQGDLFRATNSNLYQHTTSADPIGPNEAIDVVGKANPKFAASWVAHDDGVYVVGDQNYKDLYFVDPGTGEINGQTNMDQGFMGWLVNLHDCAFTCEGYPWYSSALAAPMWKGGPSFLTDITWGGFILGTLGLLLILLALSSIKIWWPGIHRLKSRFVVRRGKGRFARDYDLHNVIGAIALPFLLMWGITGAAFEFPVVHDVWITITGGEKQAEPEWGLTPKKVPAATPAVTFDQAVSTALQAVPGDATWIGRPTKDTPYWEIDIDSGYGSEKYRAVYHSDSYVLVDPHDINHLKVLYSSQGDPAANRFYDKYFEPAHFGWQVDGWWRSIWFVMGLAPLVLMITGVSTWLYRRGVRKRRRVIGEPAP